MSETNLIEHYKAELDKVKAELAEVRKEAASYRKKASEAKKQAEDLTTKLDAEVKEHAKVKAKLETAPKELQGEVDRLKGEIRTRDHRASFNDLAKEHKVRPEALDDLWALSGYKADADEVNLDLMKEVIGKAIEARPHFVETVEEPVTMAFLPPPGAGRGKPSQDVGHFSVTNAQLTDPHYMQANRAAVQQAAKDGRLKVV